MLICPCGKEIGPRRPGSGLQKTYCNNCKREKNRTQRRQWRDANPEKERRSNQQWRAANHEKESTRQKLYYQENRELLLQKHRTWEKANRLKRWNLTNEQFNEMLERQNGKCANCTLPFADTKTPYVDHDHRCCPGRKSCGRCIKGLVHHECNLGAGLLGDRSEGAGKNLAYQLRWEHKIDLSYEEILEALAPTVARKKTRLVA